MNVNEIDDHDNDPSYVPTMPFENNANNISTPEPSMPLCVTITDRNLTPEESNFTSSVTSLRYMRTPNLKCDLCNMTGYDKHSCDYLIRYVLAAEHVRKDPSIKDRIFNKHKHIVRRHRKNQNQFQKNSKWNNKRNPYDKCHSFVEDIMN